METTDETKSEIETVSPSNGGELTESRRQTNSLLIGLGVLMLLAMFAGDWYFKAEYRNSSTNELKHPETMRFSVPSKEVTIDHAHFLSNSNETLEVALDDSSWRRGFEQILTNQGTIEYVHGNETVETWSELFTAQFTRAQGDNLTRRIADKIRSDLVFRCPSAPIGELISENAGGYTFTFDGSACQAMGGERITYRVLASPNGIYVLLYSTRSPVTNAEDLHRHWQDLLLRARLVQ